MSRQFRGAVAVVTGGASGIGRALCEALGAQGAVVISVDIRPGEPAGTAEAIVLDVGDSAAVEEAVSGIAEKYGRIDYLFNNAGVSAVGEVRDLSLEDWESVFNVNFYGTLHCLRAVYPRMVRQGGGHIVNIASVYSLIPGPGCAPYAAAKSAMLSLSESLRMEAAEFGVRVSAVCPGFVRTALVEKGRLAKVSLPAFVETFPFPPMSPERCAREILKAVESGRPVTVFPLYIRALVFCHRFFPRVYWAGLKVWYKKFRKCRVEGFTPVLPGPATL